MKSEREYDEVIYTSPDGETFNQPMANSMSLLNNMIILCGHYKGVDYRIREHLITREISVGDYVLTGGELAAAIITDAVVRLIPGAIGDEQSALSDSFQVTCWLRRFIHARQIITVGKFRMCFSPATSARSTNGGCSRHRNGRHGYDRIC